VAQSITTREARTALPFAVGGLLALAVAMGIGRFAFTPLLPLMQADVGLSVKAGSWLASANYAGYLAGALAASRLRVAPLHAILGSLLVIALTTLAMGVTHEFVEWLAWRAIAGIASAFVLVHMSAWSMQRLASLQRPALGGVVFAGVGIGIAAAGLLCLGLVGIGTTAAQLWSILGCLSGVALLVTVPLLLAPGVSAANVDVSPEATAKNASFTRDEWRLIFCYSAFGLGYIIPATFLPVMAREVIKDPALFGWAWPLFGTAGTIATLVTARASNPARARSSWAIAHFVMAGGCAVAALVHDFAAVLIAALAVGGTFMVITMFAVQEARRVAGTNARPLIGAMTAAFALGQIVGPLLVHGPADGTTQFAAPLLLATLVLIVSGAALLLGSARIELLRGWLRAWREPPLDHGRNTRPYGERRAGSARFRTWASIRHDSRTS
jgi:MFS family permease